MVQSCAGPPDVQDQITELEWLGRVNDTGHE
jgi:hypothetical protein